MFLWSMARCHSNPKSLLPIHFLYLGQCVSWLEAFPHDMWSSSRVYFPKAQENPNGSSPCHSKHWQVPHSKNSLKFPTWLGIRNREDRGWCLFICNRAKVPASRKLSCSPASETSGLLWQLPSLPSPSPSPSSQKQHINIQDNQGDSLLFLKYQCLR